MAAATVIELVAAFVLPVIVIAAGHSDWVPPSVVITIGPLLLWLDHLVHVPRYRPVGWALIAGPVILVVTMAGSALAVTTGIAAGVVLLGTAAAGFHTWPACGLSARQARPGSAPRPDDHASGRQPRDRLPGQAGAGRAHSHCQQVRKASFQGQSGLILRTRWRAWRTSRAGMCQTR